MTLLFDEDTSFDSHHYAFHVNDAEFDVIFERIKKARLSYGSAPWSLGDGKLNDWNGGRGVYFKDSLGPDDGYGVKDARVATIEPDEQSAVGPTPMRSAWCALLEDIELMPQDQDFGFQPSTRLEAVAQHTDEEEGHCDHQPQ
jgi:hypothetical protein